LKKIAVQHTICWHCVAIITIDIGRKGYKGGTTIGTGGGDMQPLSFSNFSVFSF